jgi:hypothetical protein
LIFFLICFIFPVLYAALCVIFLALYRSYTHAMIQMTVVVLNGVKKIVTRRVRQQHEVKPRTFRAKNNRTILVLIQTIKKLSNWNTPFLSSTNKPTSYAYGVCYNATISRHKPRNAFVIVVQHHADAGKGCSECPFPLPLLVEFSFLRSPGAAAMAPLSLETGDPLGSSSSSIEAMTDILCT